MDDRIDKPSEFGPGLDGHWRGRSFRRRVVTEEHEHCSSCMSTGAAALAGSPAWQLGLVTNETDLNHPDGSYQLWLCSTCFDWYREKLSLILESG